MKCVMLSIRPKWVEMIASGEKTVEVRRTKPKIDVPFKCYIYCTNGDSLNYLKRFHNKSLAKFWIDNKAFGFNVARANGKVIGHFICDEIDNFTRSFFDEQTARDTDEIAEFLGLTCLTYSELCSYVGLKDFYGWHITNLVIYDKPKELREFCVEGDCDCMNCKNCAWFDRGNGYNVEDDCNLAYKGVDEHKSYKPIKRPFQSWGYVEELKGESK